MEALVCLKSMRSNSPGPVGNEIPMGGIFSIYGAARSFETAADLEPWFNKKLKIFGAGDVSGRFNDLVMCHMDLVSRHLILDHTGGLWILDWANAGFFPPSFEYAGLLHKGPGDPDYELGQDILRELEPNSYDKTLV